MIKYVHKNLQFMLPSIFPKYKLYESSIRHSIVLANNCFITLAVYWTVCKNPLQKVKRLNYLASVDKLIKKDIVLKAV
jgi:hypothetical protein